MRKFTGKDGKLRIYDRSAILHGQAPLDNLTVDIVKFDGITTYTNITSDVEADDAAFASAFLTDLDDAVFIGSTSMFAMLQFLKDAGANYAAGSGALEAYYFNGTDFSTALTGVVDGTASGGDCFAQDGYIGFKIPDDWAIGANALLAALDADKYYVKLMPTTSPTTDPDADVLCPVDGQYFEVAFAGMDFSAPLGRPKTEEILVLNRGRADANAHYVEGSDDRIFDPLELGFSCLMDDAVNKDDVLIALECGDPDSSRWTATGVSSKGTTKNDGSNLNPAFKDSTKKAVNIQMLFEGLSKNQGWAYYEVFFPKENQTTSEAEDGVTLNCKGGAYGVIERIHGFGNRY
jgi:hypothetical protein